MTGTASRLAPIPVRSVSRRRALAGGLAVASLPFVRARAAGAPIRIGFPVPLSSPYANEAIEMVRGARTAIAMFNDAGGLAGRQADLVVRDFRMDPRIAIADMPELLKSGVDFLSGGLSPAVQLAINAAAHKHDILYNALSQSDQIVAMPAWAPTTFHEGPTPHMSSHALGSYAFPQFGDRVAFLAVNYSVGKELVAGLKSVGKAHGITPVAEVYHPVGTTDFTPYLKRIAAAKPSIVFFCNYGPDQQYAIQQATWAGLKSSAKLAVPVISMTARLAAGSEAYEGVIGCASYYWRLEDTIASANRFNRRFRELNEGRVPTDYAALGFAGPMTLLTAAKQAGGTSTAQVRAAMLAMKYDLYKGPEYYRACDHQAVQAMLVLESRFTVDAADRDVFNIVKSYPGSEAMLAACATEGHK
ncbi:MAG: ABC transporter substrate-binding protein [Proteobacteria bacterium]|nr:ABC transporter substrate-binding protein [Pseudomonadota bacterium]